MIFKYRDFTAELDDITRLYPAALVEVFGEAPTQVSMEWAVDNKSRVNILGYVLVFDIDPLGEPPLNRKELKFKTKDELDEVVALLAKKLKEG